MELPSSPTTTDPHPAEEEANQLRSQYLGAEEENQTSGNMPLPNTKSSKRLSEIEPSYGICDRWRSRSQRVASSFAVGNVKRNPSVFQYFENYPTSFTTSYIGFK